MQSVPGGAECSVTEVHNDSPRITPFGITQGGSTVADRLRRLWVNGLWINGQVLHVGGVEKVGIQPL